MWLPLNGLFLKPMPLRIVKCQLSALSVLIVKTAIRYDMECVNPSFDCIMGGLGYKVDEVFMTGHVKTVDFGEVGQGGGELTWGVAGVWGLTPPLNLVRLAFRLARVAGRCRQKLA